MKRPLELYIHIPFCARKCAYCDFLSQVAVRSTHRAYVEQLIQEIACQSAYYQGYGVTTVFLGGGTPSILEAEEIQAIMEAVRWYFDLQPDAEITIEANPGTVTLEKLEAYRTCGINRISIGLQSADDEELKTLGRIHTYDDFLTTYQRVRQAGFTNVNVDLMSALPGQTVSSWKNTLKKVMMLKPEHISAYSLIIEEGTPFYDRYDSHPELLPSEDDEREMYYLTKEFLKEQGYERYEISNYAKPGYECKHNIGYWTGVEYLGLGLGASSYLQGFRFRNEADLDTYMKIPMGGPETDEKLHQEITKLSLNDRIEEFMFLGMRMTEGVSGSEFYGRFGQNMWNIYGDVLARLEKEGLIQVKMPYVRLSEFGLDVSNYVFSKFLL